jgi:hypothetical protein
MNALEAMQWRRSFAAGALALGMSLGGHFATAQSEVASCPLAARHASVVERLGPKVDAPQIAQRVARAVVALMFRRPCG